MKPLPHLLQDTPAWVEIEDSRQDRMKILASPPPAGGGKPRTFLLEVRPSEEGGAVALEQVAHRQLPKFCLERHINPGGTFCLYLDSEGELRDVDASRSWWSGLETSLNHQAYAEKYGVWPLEAGLSHGKAAHEQLAMETLADELGWRQDILRAMFRGKGWLAGTLPRISKDKDRVLNVRLPCPRGCAWKHKLMRKKSCETETCHAGCTKQHKPILRAECPNKDVIEKLVLHEHRRRQIEADLIDGLAKKGARCCRTMKACPLRQHASSKALHSG